jgi:hypothetical protein
MALSTAQDLIDSSLRLLGVIDQEGTPTSAQRNQGLDALNALIDSLVINRLANYVASDESITMASASATWGVGATINSVRPVKVLAARRVDGAYEYPVQVLDMEQYRAISDKSVSGTIYAVAYDPTYASSFGTLYVVGGVGTVKVTALKPWVQYATLATSLGLPPGYTRALRHALAIELAPEYTVPASPTSEAIVDTLMQNLKAVNSTIPDVANAYDSSARYDINSGMWT